MLHLDVLSAFSEELEKRAMNWRIPVGTSLVGAGTAAYLAGKQAIPEFRQDTLMHDMDVMSDDVYKRRLTRKAIAVGGATAAGGIAGAAAPFVVSYGGRKLVEKLRSPAQAAAAAAKQQAANTTRQVGRQATEAAGSAARMAGREFVNSAMDTVKEHQESIRGAFAKASEEAGESAARGAGRVGLKGILFGTKSAGAIGGAGRKDRPFGVGDAARVGGLGKTASVPATGLKSGVELRPHQESAVRKIMATNGDLLLSHPVGSGKTITAIAGFERLREQGRATRALVVTPASLRSNFADNGVRKFTNSRAAIFGNTQEVASGQALSVDKPDPKANYHIVSYEMFRKSPEKYIKSSGADTVIFDELHKIKNEGVTGKEIKDSRKHYRNFIGMTGSIVSNSPADLVPLVNAMTDGKHHLGTKDNFERRFVSPTGTGMQNTSVMRFLLNPYIHHVEPSPSLAAPKKVEETVKVDMSPEQQELYQYAINKMDPVTAIKFRFGTSKLKTNEVQSIFHKMTQARQVSNALHTINQSIPLSESAVRSPKIKTALDHVEDHLKETPDGQAVIYSNMIHGGVDVVSQGLKDRNIPFGTFVGKGQPGSTEKSRQQAVQDYKAGRSKVLVLSSAGGEGLDLGNTTYVATLDGHFNPEKTLQAEARGVRAGGQAHRAPEKRQVIVRRYVTTIPRSISQTAVNVSNLLSPSAMLGRIMEGGPAVYNPFKKERSPDEWAYEVAGSKAKRNAGLRSYLDKHSSAPPDCLEDLLDELEQELLGMTEKAAAASPREKMKQHRLAAQRIPFQPNRLVKSDSHIMSSYLKEFGPKLEDRLDLGAPFDARKDQEREQVYINALKKYYQEAGKGEGIAPGADDKQVYKEYAGITGIGGPLVGLTLLAPTLVPQVATSAKSALLLTGASMLGGTAAMAVAGAPTLWTPRFTTPKAKAKRMLKLDDDQLTRVLRGMQVDTEEKKIHKHYIGGR